MGLGAMVACFWLTGCGISSLVGEDILYTLPGFQRPWRMIRLLEPLLRKGDTERRESPISIVELHAD